MSLDLARLAENARVLYGEILQVYQTREKHFTDAELAAEVHRAAADVYRAKVHGLNPDGLIDRFAVLMRFASLPHFDECGD